MYCPSIIVRIACEYQYAKLKKEYENEYVENHICVYLFLIICGSFNFFLKPQIFISLLKLIY